MHGKGNQQKGGWPTLTGSLKGSGSQVPSVVFLIVGGKQHLGQAEQQLSQGRQQMPSHHIQLEVLKLAASLVIAQSLPSADGKIRKQGLQASDVQITTRMRFGTAAVHA